MTPEEEARAQRWKGLVELGRELAKGEAEIRWSGKTSTCLGSAMPTS